MKQISLLILVILVSAVCVAQITPLDDAYINTAAPTTNYGAAITLGVVSPSQTTYITFDLSSIPSGYTGSSIAKASLKLYVNTVTTAGSFNVDYVNGTWTEATLNAGNAPPPGATIAASIPLAKAQKLDYVVIDITAAVQAWLNGTEPNYGIALVANSPLSATFDSKESKTQSHPPELDVVFAPGSGGITGVLTGAGSGLQGGGTSGTLNISLLTSCASKQILQWSGSAWACSNAGTGTITGVTAGTGLSGGGTSGNVTLTNTGILGLTAGTGIASSGGQTPTISNSGILSVAAGTGISSSGGQTPTIGINTSVVPQLGVNNTFTGSQTIKNNVIIAATGTALSAQGTGTGVSGQGTVSGVYGIAGAASAYGVYGYNSVGGTGVYGAGAIGVSGTSTNNSGYGVSGSNSAASGTGVYGNAYYGVWGTGQYGVYGTSNNSSGYGVAGYNTTSTGTGVKGNGYYGVSGVSSSVDGYGVYGSDSASGGTGVYGTASGTGVDGEGGSIGVRGIGYQSSGYGVYGYNEAASGPAYGVYGSTGAIDGIGVYGSGYIGVIGYNSGVEGSYGVYGTAENSPNSWGVFSYGDFGASGSKSAIVALPDDRVVALYTIESPENWFEDFGSSQLKEGVATVQLEPTFAQTVSPEAGYHVFLTPEGDCEGLYVAQKTATGFEVRELHGGESNVAFDYRIVAKRKGLENARLEVVSADHETAESLRQQMTVRSTHTPIFRLRKPAEQAAPGALLKPETPELSPIH